MKRFRMKAVNLQLHPFMNNLRLLFPVLLAVCMTSCAKGVESKDIASVPDSTISFVIPSDLSVLTGISKYAPKGYLCGYVVTEPAGNISYGLFLVKNRKRYELVLKWSYKTETRRIDSDLANELLGSAEANLDNATDEKPVAGERGNDTGMKLVDFYDGNKVYVLMPDKAAEYRSEEIPDKIWQKQYQSFKSSLK